MMWQTWMNEEFSQPYFKSLEAFLSEALKTQTIYPPKSDWYNAFHMTPFEDLKVVIIGQDPYHGFGQAHGLSFSTLNRPLPRSLNNIYKELVSDLNVELPKSGDLSPWAKQGVLLLNTILTVEAGKPLSHQNRGWETFTLNIIKRINKLNRLIVFILWGKNAQKIKEVLDNPNHLILESAHPSPLSARTGFFGSKPFSQTNAFLKKHQVKEIDWRIK